MCHYGLGRCPEQGVARHERSLPKRVLFVTVTYHVTRDKRVLSRATTRSAVPRIHPQDETDLLQRDPLSIRGLLHSHFPGLRQDGA